MLLAALLLASSHAPLVASHWIYDDGYVGSVGRRVAVAKVQNASTGGNLLVWSRRQYQQTSLMRMPTDATGGPAGASALFEKLQHGWHVVEGPVASQASGDREVCVAWMQRYGFPFPFEDAERVELQVRWFTEVDGQWTVSGGLSEDVGQGLASLALDVGGGAVIRDDGSVGPAALVAWSNAQGTDLECMLVAPTDEGLQPVPLSRRWVAEYSPNLGQIGVSRGSEPDLESLDDGHWLIAYSMLDEVTNDTDVYGRTYGGVALALGDPTPLLASPDRRESSPAVAGWGELKVVVAGVAAHGEDQEELIARQVRLHPGTVGEGPLGAPPVVVDVDIELPLGPPPPSLHLWNHCVGQSGGSWTVSRLVAGEEIQRYEAASLGYGGAWSVCEPWYFVAQQWDLFSPPSISDSAGAWGGWPEVTWRGPSEAWPEPTARGAVLLSCP